MPILGNPYRVTATEGAGAISAQTACDSFFEFFTFIYSERESLNDLVVGDYLAASEDLQDIWYGGNKWYGLGELEDGTPELSVFINEYGRIESISICAGSPLPPPPPPPTIPAPTSPPSPPPPPKPSSTLQYAYFVLRNLSRSKKIFGYYSGSQGYPYTFNTNTSSADPGAGLIRLNSGSIGSGGGTNEIQSTEIYIDIKDKDGKENIVTYLTSLSESLHTTPNPENGFGEMQIVVSGSEFFYHRFNIKGVTFAGSNPASSGYFIVSGSSLGSGPDSNANPLSSSIAAGSGSVVEVNFFNNILPGYYQIEVGALETDYKVAAITQTGSYGSGSISQPFAIDWGTTETEFLNNNFYPSTRGYAWLWNDGYKVKHIKMNNVSFSGDILSDFIKKSIFSRFVLYNPLKADGTLLYTSPGNYPETYYLLNVTKYTSQGYTHLFVDQDNEDTTFAVDSQNFASTDFNFLAEGQYIIYASSSGDEVTPISSSGYSASLAQGYFPSGSTGYPTEQFFRGWAGANYYENGTLVSTGGNYDDNLFHFNTGSTERDYDTAPSFLRSQLPFFIDATSSYISTPSASIEPYTSQANSIKIGPTIKTQAGGNEIKYYYNEITGKILIEGGEYLNDVKSTSFDYNNKTTSQLIIPSNDTQYYVTPDGFIITVLPSQSLWLTRGKDNIGAGDTDRYLYNRYLHRPYKAYMLTTTGSSEGGYGAENYGTSSYGINSAGSSANTSSAGSSANTSIINEFDTVYIHYSQSAASLRNDGIYTFTGDLTENVGLTASVKLDHTTGSVGDIITWKTASLNIYKGSTVLTSSALYLSPSDIFSKPRITVEYPLSSGQINAGDTLKLSLNVETTDTQPFNEALLVTSYTMSIGAPVPPTDDKIPVTFDNYLELNDDCTPTLNNIANDRPNERLQDVDYSVDILDPINFEQIIADQAVRATVPESNYTQLGFANQRYFGSSTARRNINEYNDKDDVDFNNKQYYASDVSNPNFINRGKGPRLGKVANVELNNSYIAYFNELIDPYPNLNGKTAYYVKYLIDESGTIFDPTLSDINFSIFEKTFQLSDYDKKPTRVKTSLQNVEEAKELSKLNEGLSSTFKLGQYPTPILYTQTSSLGHASNIILSGSPFYGTLGLGKVFSDYAIRINRSSSYFAPQPSTNVNSVDLSTSFQTLEFDGDNITFINGSVNAIPTGSFDGSILMPVDPNGDAQTGELSDDYSINGTIGFFTSTIPVVYRDNKGDRDFLVRDPFQSVSNYKTIFEAEIQSNIKPSGSSDIAGNYDVSRTNFRVNKVTLTILFNPTLPDEKIYKPLTIEQNPDEYSSQWEYTTGGIKLTPDSFYIEDLIIKNIFGQSDVRNSGVRNDAKALIGGGWYYSPSNGFFEGVVDNGIVYRWEISFTQTNLKIDQGFYYQIKGEILRGFNQGDDYFIHQRFDGRLFKESNVTNRTFTPKVEYAAAGGSTLDTRPFVRHQVGSPLTLNDQNANGAPAPYWRRVPGTTDTLYMSSSILNQAYAIFNDEGENTNGQYYVQAKLPYVGRANVVFPNTTEPDFVEFDPVVDPWALEVGDEIRFENKENLVYTIVEVAGRQAITPPANTDSELIEDKLQIIVSPPFEDSDGNVNQPTNFDFFVVRRYKENKNFIILDQQKPYGVITTAASSSVNQSSSPGILLPEHRSEVYNRNPDEILKDLIEKRII